MADLINVKEALSLLGCDEKTLTGYITSGAIRAQKVGGKLMVDRGDVDKVATGGSGDEDVSIVLTGDSDNVNVDAGSGNKKGNTTGSITFAEEMEVVSLDQAAQTHTGEEGGMDLGFTDQNTSVMNTMVDESTGGATEAGLTTGEGDDLGATGTIGGEGGRTLRSARARIAELETPVPAWLVLCMAATLAFLTLGALPVYFLSAWPHEGERDAAGNVKRGAMDDGVWSTLAGVISVSPDPQDSGIKEADKDASWRYKDYQAAFKSETGDTYNNFIIVKVSEDGRTATAKGGKTYPIQQTPSNLDPTVPKEEVLISQDR